MPILKYANSLALLLLPGFLLGLLLCSSVVPVAHAQEVTTIERAKRFVRLTQVDPVYAWPGVELENMRLAVKALEASRAEILAFSGQYSEEQKKRIATTLYPTDYLTEMGALERQRRMLADHSTFQEIDAYQQQLLTVINKHITYLDDLLTSLERTAAEVQYKGLEYHFGRSRFTHFQAGISAYLQNAKQDILKAQKRWQCLQLESDECEEANWKIVSHPEGLEYSYKVFDAAPARITHTIRKSGRLGGHHTGPGWAILNHSDCYPDQSAIPYLTWEFPTASGVPIFRPEVVSDVYVHDHRIDENSNAYERILQSLGMEGYLFQPHTNLYACPDAADDSARLRAMIFVYDFAKKLSLKMLTDNSLKLKALIEPLSQASGDLSQVTVLSEDDVQAFMHLVTKLLANVDRKELLAELGEEQLKTLETLALGYRLKTPFFSRDIMNLVYSNTAIADYVPYAPWGFLEELMFTRNGPELLLGGTNPSIIAKNYPQIERHRNGIPPRLRSYVNDLSKQFNEKALISLLVKGLNAEYRLAKFQKRPYLFDE